MAEQNNATDDKKQQTKAKKDVKAVTFLKRHDRYNTGETAGFPTEQAEKLIKDKIAVVPSEYKSAEKKS